MYAFLAFSAAVALILLLPVRLDTGRIGYLYYWVGLIITFAIATQQFGYDVENYANFVEAYWQEPFEPVIESYMSGKVLVLIAKLTSGYNVVFSAAVVSLALLPLVFQQRAYSLNFSATIFPLVIFFALGNFKFGLSVPFIYGYFWYLSNNNFKYSSLFLLGAVVMHPQNIILTAMAPLPFLIGGMRVRKSSVILLLSVVSGGIFYVVSNLDTLPLFTRYFSGDVLSDDEMGAGAEFKLIEAAYQIVFLGLLFSVRRKLSSFRLILVGCATYHSIRLLFSLIPLLSVSLVGRGLLPFLILDILVLERIFSLRTIDRRSIYGFQMLAFARLGATLWAGSLRNAIDVHIN